MNVSTLKSIFTGNIRTPTITLCITLSIVTVATSCILYDPPRFDRAM